MREKLREIDGVRASFTATFVRYGSKPAYKGPPIKTLLLRDVRDASGRELTDHLWFTTNKQFEALNLQPGEQIAFDARSRVYEKGYRRRHEWGEIDWRLSHPTNIRRHGFAKELADLPLFSRSVDNL